VYVCMDVYIYVCIYYFHTYMVYLKELHNKAFAYPAFCLALLSHTLVTYVSLSRVSLSICLNPKREIDHEIATGELAYVYASYVCNMQKNVV